MLKRKIGARDVAPILMWVLLACSLLPKVPIDFWMFGLPDHFRFHYMVLAVFALGFSFWFKQWKYSAGLLLIVVHNLLVISPWLWTSPSRSDGPESSVSSTHSLVWLNVNTGSRSHQVVLDYLKQQSADTIVLGEVNANWIQSLDTLTSLWPYQILQPREDNFGVAVYSKYPFVSQDRLTFDALEVPAIEISTQFGGGRNFSILAIHPVPPIGKTYTQSRDSYLENMGGHISKREDPLIVIGDFNATPWHAPVRQLIHTSGLSYACPESLVFPATWPTCLFGLGIPIDLCLVDKSVKVIQQSVGPNLGSDHLPLELEFLIRSD